MQLRRPVPLLVILLAAPALSLPDGGGPCSSDLDCQLNGECTAGACVCDAAWTGANCSVLALLPARWGTGYGSMNSSVSSWGGGVSRDPGSGKYYLFAAEMNLNCGLQVPPPHKTKDKEEVKNERKKR